MVLKNCGPIGYPGHGRGRQHGPAAEAPQAQGVTDMVRISDARMSGTAYGTVVLHVAPEAALGGPLALVENGDMIELDVPEPPAAPRGLRRGAGAAPRRLGVAGRASRAGGYARLYVEHVLQADEGADFDFLVGCRGSAVPRESH